MNLQSLTTPVDAAYQAARRRWDRHQLSRRLWAGDATVWDADPETPELADRLGWLRLHETMRPHLGEIRDLAGRVAADSERVVLCGMGGSSLAPEVFAAVLGGDGPTLEVLDSTHPEAVASLRDRIDPSATTFVVSSKSGTTLETLSFFRTFWDAAGGEGGRFVAITDPGTPLADLAAERGFRATFSADPEVGGRFSALTHFGLVPAALSGIDPEPLLDAAAELAGRGDTESSGVDLGLAWGTLATAGRDKLTVLTSPSLAAFPAWMEQLLAESLGKQGTGIVPIAGEPTGAGYGDDRMFTAYALAGEEVAGLDRLDASQPIARVDLPHPAALAAEMLRAEVATAVAGEVLGVHPFDQPNVEAAKRLAREAMSGDLDLGQVPTLDPAEAPEALSEVLDSSRPGDYLGIHAYLPRGDELEGQLTDLRAALASVSGLPTTFGWGPRFLHSTGQLHKGGPDSGIFVQLVDQPSTDLDVPETDHSYRRIVAAQAAGDHQALAEAGRRVVRIDLGSDRRSALESLVSAVAP